MRCALLALAGSIMPSKSGSSTNTNNNNSATNPDPQIFSLTEQIIYTLIITFLIVIFFFIDVYLIVRRKTEIGRKKFTIYRAMCNLGALFYALEQFGPIWVGTEYFSSLKYRWAFLFYFLGYPSMYVPILLRSWRIVCVYKQTLDLRRCRLTDLMKRHKRGDRWFLLRYITLMSPFVILFPFVFLEPRVDYAILALQFCYILVFVSLAIVHCTLRRELKKYDIDETNMLLFLGLCLIAFWAVDIFLWYYVIRSASIKIGVIAFVAAKLAIGAICVVHPLIALLRQDLGCGGKNNNKKKKNNNEEEDEAHASTDQGSSYVPPMEVGIGMESTFPPPLDLSSYRKQFDSGVRSSHELGRRGHDNNNNNNAV